MKGEPFRHCNNGKSQVPLLCQHSTYMITFKGHSNLTTATTGIFIIPVLQMGNRGKKGLNNSSTVIESNWQDLYRSTLQFECLLYAPLLL